ncbi:hypothetical protein M426DRAFT_317186 [Hypoxylon sp. CI-4A]|nr:hypothetical protein M426DRAFT_317186 [Hypoxylon sp. CI-4A]
MPAPKGARLPVGSAQWISEERSSALQIAQSEVEEFSFSARNDFDWLNEHMAEIFSENQINVAEIFKTPGKLRGKTPRTTRKINAVEARVPLSDIFSATPKGQPNPFALPSINRGNTPRIEIPTNPQPSPPKATAPPSPVKHVAPTKPTASNKPAPLVDSGYHGSQSQEDAMDIDHVDLDDEIDDETTQAFSLQANTQGDYVDFHTSDPAKLNSPTHHSPNPTLETNAGDVDTQYFTANIGGGASPYKDGELHESTTPAGSPNPTLLDESPAKPSPTKQVLSDSQDSAIDADAMETVLEEPSRSSSDTSSPIRPIVRKSSLNFASLPAREPMTHKSIGNRVSRTSHLDQVRTSHYNRQTGGKSLGQAKHDLTDDDEDNDDMDIDEDHFTHKSQQQSVPENTSTHNKTYTQRLQDQISKLGQSQVPASRTSKSIPDPSISQQAVATTSVPQTQSHEKPLSSPKKTTTPGAFPDEEEDDWIEPLGSPENASDARSPRPGLAKSYSADVMEGVSGKQTVGGSAFAVPKTRSKSPERAPERAGNAFGHHKSMSVPMLPFQAAVDPDGGSLKKTISASNPPLPTVSETERPTTPTKSPSRAFRDSPLKQVKNKLSSILKSSRGLLASGAAISAEGKASLLMSPSSTRLGFHTITSSTDTLVTPQAKEAQPLYPDLSQQAADVQARANAGSPTRMEGRRTRASIEREKAEEKRKEKEAKEAKRMAEQNEKLEKAREKEREKARVFSKEQERVAAMEKQLAAQKEQDKKATIQTPGNPSKSARPSPRKGKAQPATDDRTATTVLSDDKDSDDIDMVDAPNPMPPPSIPRPTAPPSANKGREIKRPMRPGKEPVAKPKQAPTVIRVNMGSQHPQYHPSNSTLSSSLQDTLSQPPPKSSQPSLQPKPSLQSLKSSTSSTGRPKALEAAARRREQEEREAQRKRDAKAELERKRAAMQEEEKRQEQQRKAEAERQKEEERKQAAAQAEAKKAQRQAMLDKAKQTRAPPPAARSQPNGPPDYSRAESSVPRPPSRLASNAPRSQEEVGRPINTMLPNASKAPSKRPLQQDYNDNGNRQAPTRGTGYQSKESKRMRMTDEFEEEVEKEKQPSLKGAPVRPSAGYKKDVPSKSTFQAGYTNASMANNRDLFKTTVTSQHNSQIKAAHPLDMAQVSKGHIPFAPNPNAAGPSYKTPARPQGMAAAKSTAKSVAKSATRSSPRFQNGESIELPEINTDDEDDEYEDSGSHLIASWADSPNLRRALVEQESKDPFEVFGAPGPLNMEEVFAKSKDRFHKFRARTSSANWSGSDRLTEEDIRKDLAARDKLRRDGGWSYEMSKDMV